MARICMISEGAYPYVVGGVSSWVHDLISINKDHEFVLVCIVPSEEFIVTKYELPKNLVEVRNIILNPKLEISNSQVIKNNLKTSNKKQKEIQAKIEKTLDFKGRNIKEKLELMDELTNGELGNPFELLVSKIFWNALESHYSKHYKDTNFNTFYWTYRNISINVLQLMVEEIPKADIYHSVSTGYAGFLSAVAGYRNMGKTILTEHGMYPREREEEIIRAPWIEKSFKEIWVDFFFLLSSITYEYTDEIISLFEYNKNLQIEYGASSKKCSVIANGVDIERFSNLKKEKKEEFCVGAIFRVVPIKDVKMMLKAIKMAHRKMRNAKFFLIGPTDENKKYYEECKQIVVDLEMESYVEFTGKVQVDEYYRFLDLLLLTSISEGQPLSILEGLAAGIPFVSTDVGNCREILTEKRDIGEAGIIVPPTSYVEFGDAIIKLYQNRDRLEEFGKNGKEIVKTYYPRDRFVKKYKDLYERLGEVKWQE